MKRFLFATPLAFLLACGSETPVDEPEPEKKEDPTPTDQGLPILGGGTHDPAEVEITLIADATIGLSTPRDLTFHPHVPNQLWVVNRADNSISVVHDAGTPAQVSEHFSAFGSDHFLVQPSALAFSDNGNFGTAHEEDEKTQPQTPADFMGPTLWSSDMMIFDGGHAGHLDMLHNSPNGMGIAWDVGNAFWVFDGYHGALTRYDFVADHGPGGEDHTDGIVRRYAEGQVLRQGDIPSHMVFDHATAKLYVADTGNHRIAVLDTTMGSMGGDIFPNYDGSDQRVVDGAIVETFIDTTQYGSWWPSGLERYGDHWFVTDWQSATIFAYDLEGNLVDYLPLGLPEGSLMGITFDAEGNLWAVDAVQNQIFRIAPKPETP